jgi:hypothetical protein
MHRVEMAPWTGWNGTMNGLKWHHGLTLSWKASKWDNNIYRESADELYKLTDQIFQEINWRGSLKLDVLGINNAMLQGYLLILA